VLHHLPGAAAIAALLNECVRVSATLVIVEEVTGPKTDIARARAFDSDMNGHLHPGVPMPVFGYLSAEAVKAQLSAAGAPPVAHRVARWDRTITAGSKRTSSSGARGSEGLSSYNVSHSTISRVS